MNIFKDEIKNLKDTFQYRNLKCIESAVNQFLYFNGKKYINFGSNNYLSLSSNKKVKKAYIDGINKWGCGTGASRLVTGSFKVHFELEKALADFSKKESALLFPSGYMANIGLISAISDKNDIIILDKTNHASIIDGARLSGIDYRIFPHLNYNYLEDILKKSNAKKKIIVTDSIFSMDGDMADLKTLADLKNKYNAILIVDEAHAVGVFGKNGEGLSEKLNVTNDIDFKIGTLSKSFGLQGGYIAASNEAIDFLKNKSRSFIYTTAISPGICTAALKALELIKNNFEQKRIKYRKKFLKFAKELNSLGFSTCNSVSQIIPVIIPGNENVLAIEKELSIKSLLVPAIRYPTVKKGTERLRISILEKHTTKELNLLLNVLSDIKG